MFSIQWYDPYMPENQQPFKDGKPVGKFDTKELAEKRAEELNLIHGSDIPYEIVELQ